MGPHTEAPADDREGLPVPLADQIRRIALVACDWNGTLVADTERACRATNHVLAQLGLPTLDVAAFRSAFLLPLGRFFSALGVATPLLAGAEVDWNRWMATERAAAAPGAAAFLAAANAAGVPIGVVSAAAATGVERDAAALGLREGLAFVVGGSNPKRTALAELARTTQGSVLYVGDTEYDMAEAIAAGVVPVGVAWGYRPAAALRAAGAAVVVEDLAEIKMFHLDVLTVEGVRR